MYNHLLQQQINSGLAKANIKVDKHIDFYARLVANASAIETLYNELYSTHAKAKECFAAVIETIVSAYNNRSETLRKRDAEKQQEINWFLSNKLAGMSLYADRFAGSINGVADRLGYLKNLGINTIHLMPVFVSPAGESDGGYAVSDFRKVDERFGTLNDLQLLQQKMADEDMYLMLDIVLNHTSHRHEWAQKAKAGDVAFQNFFYMYNDRGIPDWYEQTMPDIFPESAPGSFTYNEECGKWVMSVFHNYQWDLNYTNPAVFVAMLDTIFFYANIGVDILRIDAPAFIWKQLGTSCQNLPQAHSLLRLIKLCVNTAAPGMALLGEAIVAPKDIMHYFGTGQYTAHECDFAYNATHMALQWDALASGNTKVMLAAQHEILKKPYGTSWITYTRCHDDIGLGYDDYMIHEAGFNAFIHRSFIKDYYSGRFDGSTATGALFSFNPKTNDARISGSLASLCGLEKAVNEQNEKAIGTAISKIIMMQAHSFFLGGLPMLFYGDEAAYTNDYSYLKDDGKAYDNRWMHRPIINWDKNEKTTVAGTVEHRIFSATQKLLSLRKQLAMVADHSNITWLSPHNIHVAAYARSLGAKRLFCVFNFSDEPALLTWYAFKEQGNAPSTLYDHWRGKTFAVGQDYEYLKLDAYAFYLLEDLG
jgi:amylosucrase